MSAPNFNSHLTYNSGAGISAPLLRTPAPQQAKNQSQSCYVLNQRAEDDGLSFALDALNTVEKHSPDAYHKDGSIVSPALAGISESSLKVEDVPFNSPNSDIKLMILKLRNMRDHKKGGIISDERSRASDHNITLDQAPLRKVDNDGKYDYNDDDDGGGGDNLDAILANDNSPTNGKSAGNDNNTRNFSSISFSEVNTPILSSIGKSRYDSNVNTNVTDFSEYGERSSGVFSSTKKKISFALHSTPLGPETSPREAFSRAKTPSPILATTKRRNFDLETPKIDSRLDVDLSSRSYSNSNSESNNSDYRINRGDNNNNNNSSSSSNSSGHDSSKNTSRDRLRYAGVVVGEIFDFGSDQQTPDNKYASFLGLDVTSVGAASAMKILLNTRAYLASPDINSIINNSTSYGNSNYIISLAMLMYNHLADIGDDYSSSSSSSTSNNYYNISNNSINSSRLSSSPLMALGSSNNSVSNKITDGSYCSFYSSWLRTHVRALARIICMIDIFNQWCSYSGVETASPRNSKGVGGGGGAFGSLFNFGPALGDLRGGGQGSSPESGDRGDSPSGSSFTKQKSSDSTSKNSNNKSSSYNNKNNNNSSSSSSSSRKDNSVDDFEVGDSKANKFDYKAGSSSDDEDPGTGADTGSGDEASYRGGNRSGSSRLQGRHIPLIVDGIDHVHMNFMVKSCFLKFQELILIKKRTNKRFISVCLKTCYNSQYLGKSSRSAQLISHIPKLSLRKLFLTLQPKLLYVINNSKLMTVPTAGSPSKLRAGKHNTPVDTSKFVVTRDELVCKVYFLRCFRRFYHRVIYSKRFRDTLILHRLFLSRQSYNVMKKIFNNQVIVDKHLSAKSDSHFETSKFRKVRMISLLQRWNRNIKLKKALRAHIKKLQQTKKIILFPLQCLYRPLIVKCFLAIKEYYIEQIKGLVYTEAEMKRFDDYYYRNRMSQVIRCWRVRNAKRFWQAIRCHLAVGGGGGSNDNNNNNGIDVSWNSDKKRLLSLNTTVVAPRLESNFNILFWKLVINCWSNFGSSGMHTSSFGGKCGSMPGLDTISSLKMDELRYICVIEGIFKKFKRVSQIAYAFERLYAVSKIEYATIYFTRSNFVLNYRRKIVARYGETSSQLFYFNEKASRSSGSSSDIGSALHQYSSRRATSVSNSQLAKLDNFSCVRVIKNFKNIYEDSEEEVTGNKFKSVLEEGDGPESDNGNFANFYSKLTRRFNTSAIAQAKTPSKITKRSDSVDLEYDFSNSYSNQAMERNTFFLSKKTKPLFVLTYDRSGMQVVPVTKFALRDSGIGGGQTSSYSSSSSSSSFKSPNSNNNISNSGSKKFSSSKGSKSSFNKIEIFFPFAWQMLSDPSNNESASSGGGGSFSAVNSSNSSSNKSSPRYLVYSQTRMMIGFRFFIKNCKKSMTLRAAFAKVSKKTGLKLQRSTFSSWFAYYKLDHVMKQFRLKNVISRLKEKAVLHRRILIGTNKAAKLATATTLNRCFRQLHASIVKSTRAAYKVAGDLSGHLDDVGGMDGVLECVKFMFFTYISGIALSKASKGSSSSGGKGGNSGRGTSTISASAPMNHNLSSRLFYQFLVDKASHNNKGFKKGFLYKCFISQNKAGFKSMGNQKKFSNLEAYYDSTINKAYYTSIVSSSVHGASAAGVSGGGNSNNNNNNKYAAAESSFRPKWLGISWKRLLSNEVMEMMSVRRVMNSYFRKLLSKLRLKQLSRQANKIISMNKERIFIHRLQELANLNIERRAVYDKYRRLILKRQRSAFNVWRVAKIAKRSSVLLTKRCFRYFKHGSHFLRACRMKMAIVGGEVSAFFHKWKSRTFSLKRNLTLVQNKTDGLLTRYCFLELMMLRRSLLAFRRYNFVKTFKHWKTYVWSSLFLEMKERKSSSSEHIFLKKSQVLKKKKLNKKRQSSSSTKKDKSAKLRNMQLFEEEDSGDDEETSNSKDPKYYSRNSITFFYIRNKELLIHRINRMLKVGWMKYLKVHKTYKMGSYSIFKDVDENDLEHPRARIMATMAIRLFHKRLYRFVPSLYGSGSKINNDNSNNNSNNNTTINAIATAIGNVSSILKHSLASAKRSSSRQTAVNLKLGSWSDGQLLPLSAYRALQDKRMQKLRSIVLFRKFRSKVRKSIADRSSNDEFRNGIISIGNKAIFRRVICKIRENISARVEKLRLTNSFVFRRSCSAIVAAFSRARSKSIARKELHLFVDIFRLRYIISRAIRIWRFRFVCSTGRARSKSSERFSVVYFDRRLLAIAMIYFKSTAAKYVNGAGRKDSAPRLIK